MANRSNVNGKRNSGTVTGKTNASTMKDPRDSGSAVTSRPPRTGVT